LMKERVDPYYWNRQIPHQRDLLLGHLFVAADRVVQKCRFARSTGESDVRLSWTRVDPKLADELRSGADRSAMFELKDVAGVRFLRLPTFERSTPEQVSEIRTLIDTIKARAGELRQGPLVLDARGNTGGNSTWGEEIAAALWGEAWVQHVSSQLDWRTDWRVSKDNLASIERNIKILESGGHEEAAASTKRLRERVQEALAAGQPFVRAGDPPKPKPRPRQNPVKGPVYLLTDQSCFSACLDFADVVRKLPGTVHIGFPTSADTIYMENAGKLLPSRLAGFSYPMKAYRNRARGSNIWYDPHVGWPGGAMTEQALAQWIRRLATQPSPHHIR
ncbi:MAG TPA: S41 family peptidase, partial [Chloroflexota bacterium]|nr:S41 family peptidase [Chloroflexota bacterium]